MYHTHEATDDAVPAQSTRCHVAIGDAVVTHTGSELVTYGLGSCLGIVLYDAEAGVAGLAHIKRPTAPEPQAATDAAFADTGIVSLVREMKSYGATRRHTVAKLVGGTDMQDADAAVGRGIGKRNITQAKTTLATLDITVTDTDVGGEAVRSLYVDGGSGEATIETACGARYSI